MPGWRVALNLILGPPAAVLAMVCAAAGVIAQWGRTSLTLDAVAHFAPLWLLGAALALALALVFEGWLRRVVLAVGLLGVISAGSLVAPEFLRNTGPHAPADAPGQLKVVQFNAWHDNPDPKAILAWLDKVRPDIVVLEENSARLSTAAKVHGGWSIACTKCEVMILSRRPALHVVTERRVHGRPVPLIRAEFSDSHGPFSVVGLHNAWPMDRDQPFQEQRLAQVIHSTPNARLIVVGDFNSAPWSFQRRRWDKAFGIVRRDRALPTWPARTYGDLRWLGLPFLPIDHVYAGPGWATVSIERGPRLGSDHYPLVITLAPVAPR